MKKTSAVGGRAQLAFVALVAVIAGLAGGLLAQPVSAVPEALRFSFVESVARSSTRAAGYFEQRGSGPVLELKKPTGTTSPLDVRLGQPVRINKLLIVPFGTDAGIVTMTPTPTNTPTATNTPTITPSPTP